MKLSNATIEGSVLALMQFDSIENCHFTQAEIFADPNADQAALRNCVFVNCKVDPPNLIARGFIHSCTFIDCYLDGTGAL